MWLPNLVATLLTTSLCRKLVAEIDEIRSGVWDDKILVSLGAEPEKPQEQEPPRQEQNNVPELQVTETPQVQQPEEETVIQADEEAVPEVAMVSLPNL